MITIKGKAGKSLKALEMCDYKNNPTLVICSEYYSGVYQGIQNDNLYTIQSDYLKWGYSELIEHLKYRIKQDISTFNITCNTNLIIQIGEIDEDIYIGDLDKHYNKVVRLIEAENEILEIKLKH